MPIKDTPARQANDQASEGGCQHPRHTSQSDWHLPNGGFDPGSPALGADYRRPLTTEPVLSPRRTRQVAVFPSGTARMRPYIRPTLGLGRTFEQQLAPASAEHEPEDLSRELALPDEHAAAFRSPPQHAVGARDAGDLTLRRGGEVKEERLATGRVVGEHAPAVGRGVLQPGGSNAARNPRGVCPSQEELFDPAGTVELATSGSSPKGLARSCGKFVLAAAVTTRHPLHAGSLPLL